MCERDTDSDEENMSSSSVNVRIKESLLQRKPLTKTAEGEDKTGSRKTERRMRHNSNKDKNQWVPQKRERGGGHSFTGGCIHTQTGEK